MATEILILMTYSHLFFCFQDTIHWPSAVTNRFKRNINEELHQAMSTSFDIKARKDHIFKKCLNAGYPRTFIYLVLNAFDAISAH